MPVAMAWRRFIRMSIMCVAALHFFLDFLLAAFLRFA
jgi:hypothetical protein